MSVYEILEVKPDASDEEIKRKYHELAKRYHPDKNNGDDTKMSEITEAYRMIDTPAKRHEYDTKNAFVAEFDMLSTVFGRPTVAENFKNPPKLDERMKNGTDIKLKVKIPVDVFLGGAKSMPIKFKRNTECQECSGTGGGSERTCSACGGYGYVVLNGRKTDCTKCNGVGKVKIDQCKECSGKGVVTKTIEKVLSYNPGRLAMTVPNAGNSGLFGGTNGNLKVTFSVQPVDGINYDPALKAVPVTVEVYPEDIVLGVTKVVSVGAWSSYVTLEPSDFDKLPAKKRIGNADLLVSVKVIREKDDIKRAQAWRDSRINDII